MPRKLKDIRIHFPLDKSSIKSDSNPYSEEAMAAIRTALNVPNNEDAYLSQIIDAAIKFKQAKDVFDKRKSTAEVRKEAQKAAEKLMEAKNCLSVLDLERREIDRPNYSAKDLNFVSVILESLRDDFVAVDEAWKNRTKKRSSAPKELFVSYLIQIWIEAHGSLPTRVVVPRANNSGYDSGGVSLNFVRACVSPLDSSTGINDIFQTCLGNLNRK